MAESYTSKLLSEYLLFSWALRTKRARYQNNKIVLVLRPVSTFEWGALCTPQRRPQHMIEYANNRPTTICDRRRPIFMLCYWNMCRNIWHRIIECWSLSRVKWMLVFAAYHKNIRIKIPMIIVDRSLAWWFISTYIAEPNFLNINNTSRSTC